MYFSGSSLTFENDINSDSFLFWLWVVLDSYYSTVIFQYYVISFIWIGVRVLLGFIFFWGGGYCCQTFLLVLLLFLRFSLISSVILFFHSYLPFLFLFIFCFIFFCGPKFLSFFISFFFFSLFFFHSFRFFSLASFILCFILSFLFFSFSLFVRSL